jgi:hypothetical protein
MPSRDAPVHAKATTVGQLMECVVHPAFRLGFLDARAGRPIDHDKIMDRILAETPAGALKRMGWSTEQLFDGLDVFSVDSFSAKRAARSFEIAQYRYEEGRALFLEYGVRCKAWGHPDYPPVAVREFLFARVKELNETSQPGE